MTDDTQGQPIEGLNEALATGFETADFEALGRLYTEDSILMPPRSRPVRGPAAILSFWSGVRNRFAGMVFTSGDFKQLGDDVARETGTYAMAAGEGGGNQSAGKFMIVWQKIDGAWRIESSIWTRNADAAQQRPGQGGGGQGGGGQGGGGQAGRGQGGGQGGGYRQGGQGGGQGGYRQGGGQGGNAGGGYRQGGYGGGQGNRNRGGIGGQQGGIGGGGSGIGGGGARRGNPQQGGRRGQGGQAGQGGAGSLYDNTNSLYSARDD